MFLVLSLLSVLVSRFVCFSIAVSLPLCLFFTSLCLPISLSARNIALHLEIFLCIRLSMQDLSIYMSYLYLYLPSNTLKCLSIYLSATVLFVICVCVFFFQFYFPARLVVGITLCDLLDNPRSQLSSLLPSVRVSLLSRTGLSVFTFPRFTCYLVCIYLVR